MNAIELEKVYNPKDFEERLYKKWNDEGYFKPASDESSPVHEFYKKNIQVLTPLERAKKSYTVVIPPPNVTGVLHVGHGLNNALQDIVVRYHRMKGDNTLWVTGTDHAGIATQNVVEKALKKEGKRRSDLGREKFLERTWKLKDEHHAIIVEQQKKLGNSTDWSRERFTMDEGLSKAVRNVFVTLYERGLIYRGNYLVNWCPRCTTALSDDEVEHIDKNGAMYHIYYEYEDGAAPDGSTKIEIATTRPETLLGDTAVAVNPSDERYKNIVGKKLKLPLTNRVIPIIADSYVDKEFGTGMVKITPAHDPNDFQVGKRNNLDILNILNPDGTLNENVPEKYRGLSCAEARKIIIKDLEEQGLFKAEEKITHSVGHCYRCNTVVEPFLSDQWFVKMQPLAEKALKAWQDGKIKFFPKKWENTYKVWLENIRDWCISRQLWWGHRIPVWYCKDCNEMTVSRVDVKECAKCKSKNIFQDEDVLDTWFSSWLWPFTTLGWPEKTSDLEKFFPTTALVTAYDIIFFWVSRMIMASLEFMGDVPFRDIYIHGLVRDKQGRKMSKSLGNGIDPLEIISLYGSDAFKFTLGFMCAQGQDVLVDKDSFKLGSRFSNKVWNASRYILSNLEGRTLRPIKDSDLTDLDKWIYGQLNACVKKVRDALENYRYNEAASSLYEYFWNEYCDWYVEATKLSFKNGDEAEKDRAASVLLNVLEENMRLLHPFIPFVTEEIYSHLPLKEIVQNRELANGNKIISQSLYCGMLIAAPYPEEVGTRDDKIISDRFNILREFIKGVRSLRVECGLDPAKKINVDVLLESGSESVIIKEKVEVVKLLAGIADVNFILATKTKSIGFVGKGFEAFLQLDESINREHLKEKFEKEETEASAILQRARAKLSGKFAEHAAKELVEAERAKVEENERKIQKLESYIASL
ncbi:MAG: valine--tRNA ligase [Treponema sp.]|nr:valine--tRNA ligase [Treponema sp.]